MPQNYNIDEKFGKNVHEIIFEKTGEISGTVTDEEGKFFLITMAYKAFIDTKPLNRNFSHFDFSLAPMGLLEGFDSFKTKTERRTEYFKKSYPDLDYQNPFKMQEKLEKSNHVFETLQEEIANYLDRTVYVVDEKYDFLEELKTEYKVFWDGEKAILPKPAYGRKTPSDSIMPENIRKRPSQTSKARSKEKEISAPAQQYQVLDNLERDMAIENLPPFLLDDETHYERLEIYDALDEGLKKYSLEMVTGCFGCGKTTLVNYYAHLKRLDYEYIIWIDATSRATITKSIADFSAMLSIRKKDPLKNDEPVALRAFLNEHSNWLLIIDHAWFGNLEDTTMIEDCMPESSLWFQGLEKQRIIITTIFRHHPFGNCGILQVPPYTDTEQLLSVGGKQDMIFRLSEIKRKLEEDAVADASAQIVYDFLDFWIYGLKCDVNEMVYLFCQAYPFLISNAKKEAMNLGDGVMPVRLKLLLSRYSLFEMNDKIITANPVVPEVMPLIWKSKIIDWNYLTSFYFVNPNNLLLIERDFLTLNDYANRIYRAFADVKYYLFKKFYYLVAKRCEEIMISFSLRIYPRYAQWYRQNTHEWIEDYTPFFYYFVRRCVNIKVFSLGDDIVMEDRDILKYGGICEKIYEDKYQAKFKNIEEELDLVLVPVLATMQYEGSVCVSDCQINIHHDLISILETWIKKIEKKTEDEQINASRFVRLYNVRKALSGYIYGSCKEKILNVTRELLPIVTRDKMLDYLNRIDDLCNDYQSLGFDVEESKMSWFDKALGCLERYSGKYFVDEFNFRKDASKKIFSRLTKIEYLPKEIVKRNISK